MENLGNLIKGRFQRPPKPTTERGELLQYFTDGVNAGRDGKTYKKLTIGFIAKKLQGLEMRDLYYMKSVLVSETRRGQPFGKVFFGMLKSNDKPAL